MATSCDHNSSTKHAHRSTEGDGFLSRPFARATLADHSELELSLNRTGQPFEDEVLRFFGLKDTEVTASRSNHPQYELPQIHHALARCFPDWKPAFEGGGDRCQQLWAPKDRRIEIAPGKFREYLSDGTRFYLLPNGGRRVALFEESEYQPGWFQFSLIGPREERSMIRAELEAIKRWRRRNHYLRGQAIRADGTLLRKAAGLTWNDVVLDDAVRRSLLVNVVDFLKLRKTFKRNGVPQKRGILLYGPPGTGKTLIGKVLAGLGGTTFVYVTAGDVRNPCALRIAFKLARTLRPVIIFLEDLDFYAADRHLTRDQSVLGELLAQMDGLERNDGLVVLATTNDL
ncbi:MAG: ATP-binding protein, partial [Planctomycetes bacterium]|nr:ATP-binding protein [Planctomycetota bacterium]